MGDSVTESLMEGHLLRTTMNALEPKLDPQQHTPAAMGDRNIQLSILPNPTLDDREP